MQQRKRVLIVSHLFYPHPSVASVRVTQWCRFLPEFDWQPLVLCQYQGHLATPELLREKVHPDVQVEYFDSPAHEGTPAPPVKHPLWMRAALRWPFYIWPVPDTSILTFWRRARFKVLDFVRRYQPDVILTTSPPHAFHYVGLWLAKRVNIPWVADFRDPYIIDSRFQLRGKRRVRWRAHKNYERRIYEQAALILHAIPSHARWARMAYPFARDRIVTLPNGCPPELLEGRVTPSLAEAGCRSIRVIGSLYSDEAELLARAVKVLIESGANVELRIVGGTLTPTETDSLRQVLGDKLVAFGAVSHEQALEQVAGADVLICSLNRRRSQGVGLSSKLFEYLATGKPIIVINPTQSDRQFLRKFQGTRLLQTPDVKQLTQSLEWALEPAALPPASQNEMLSMHYNRRTQTQQLARWLSRVATPAATSSGWHMPFTKGELLSKKE